MMTEDYLDDNVVIPEDIMKMTPEEVKTEIARLEAELDAQKRREEKKAV